MVTTGNDYIGAAAESRFPDHDRQNRAARPRSSRLILTAALLFTRGTPPVTYG
jgi:hypothetical protein